MWCTHNAGTIWDLSKIMCSCMLYQSSVVAVVINGVPGSWKCWMRNGAAVMGMQCKTNHLFCWWKVAGLLECFWCNYCCNTNNSDDRETWNVHLLPSDLQSCPLYINCLSIVIWSGFTADFACTVLYVLSPVCGCLFVCLSILWEFLISAVCVN